MPTYNTIQSGEVLPLFVFALVFNSATYRGETGRNKKEAKQFLHVSSYNHFLLDKFSSLCWITNAADDRYGTVVSEIIKSKAKLYDALNRAKDSSFDTTLAGANRLNHNNTEVENNAVTNHVPNTTHPSFGAKHPRHEFKIRVDLPIAFVLRSDVGESSSKIKRKMKKRAKGNTNTQ
ncbi:hypothetical protein GOBAR_DD09179 [Gossypium barbadense]|nr:hypothetical protein GOBAR_DD09179 [Gossypium barbadense]